MIDKLIELSKIFKAGFTVELIGGEICQYVNFSKPYIVSYKTLIVINKGNTNFYPEHIPLNCIIGGWLDTDTGIFYIELNQVFKTQEEALIFAEVNSQKAIYDSKNGHVIKV